MTGGMITLQRKEMKRTAILLSTYAAINRQVPVAAGSSWKAVQPLPLTVPRQGEVLDTTAPAAHGELSQDARNSFINFYEAMKAV